MKEIVTTQDESISLDMKIEDVKDYGDFINYLIVKAIKNIVKYADYSYEEILKDDYSFDQFYFSICKNFNMPSEEHYENSEFLQDQLKRFGTKYIRQTEYNIYFIM
jgi:hypothetical protein